MSSDITPELLSRKELKTHWKKSVEQVLADKPAPRRNNRDERTLQRLILKRRVKPVTKTVEHPDGGTQTVLVGWQRKNSSTKAGHVFWLKEPQVINTEKP